MQRYLSQEPISENENDIPLSQDYEPSRNCPIHTQDQSPECAKFSEEHNIYLHFISFLHNDMTQVVEILPQVRQGPTYST